MAVFPEPIKWEQCQECGEYVPQSQLILDPKTKRYLCDVCTYELYMKRMSQNDD